MSVYIIAEAGVNHNGDKNLAFRLCDAAKAAGVDAVKFQTWKTEKIVTKSAELAEYQENNITDKSASQFEMLKQLELSYNEFVEVRDYCNHIGIQFLSTPDTEEDMDFLLGLDIPFLKIGSGEVTNIPFLRAIGKRHLFPMWKKHIIPCLKVVLKKYPCYIARPTIHVHMMKSTYRLCRL